MIITVIVFITIAIIIIMVITIMTNLLSSSWQARYVQDKACLLSASKKCHKQSSRLATHQSWKARLGEQQNWSWNNDLPSVHLILTCEQMLAGKWGDWYRGPRLEKKCQSALVNFFLMTLRTLAHLFICFSLFVLMAGMLLALMPVPAADCLVTWHCKLPCAAAHAAARQREALHPVPQPST